MTPSDQKNHFYSVQILIISVITSLVVGGFSGAVGGFLLTTVGWKNVSEGKINWNEVRKKFYEGTITEAQPQPTPQKNVQVVEDSATVSVVEKVNPSVVSIVLTKDYGQFYSDNPFFDFFGFPFSNPPQGEQKIGAGTGFIISPDGLILTNRHVVSEEDVDYTVTMNDQSTYNAKVVAIDSAYDIALLKIEANNLPALELGDSDSLRIGQTVIAIGNVLGEYQNSVTRGVISGIDRTVPIEGDILEDVIQTDASINSGNSGGPLVNLDGQVIGINTAVDRGGEAIAFAVPSNFAKSAIESYQKNGSIVRPYLGVRYLPIDDAVAAQNKLSYTYGALVIRGENASELAIIPGSPADKAGIEENDIILEMNGKRIGPDGSLAHLIRQRQVGETVTLLIFHDQSEKQVSVTLEAQTNEPENNQ